MTTTQEKSTKSWDSVTKKPSFSAKLPPETEKQIIYWFEKTRTERLRGWRLDFYCSLQLYFKKHGTLSYKQAQALRNIYIWSVTSAQDRALKGLFSDTIVFRG